ncbi:hypothetical protein [Saccharopolyspora elongata]|uniref:Multiple sugar transport system ATP-binding protein n=1 Tax=Saccharopolyspora elongata TaxID=2530387 RepID=A0A4R4XQQ0_9PSEU|nr:hypothetical protein [Saccharopolyspora elongata]TDD32892.1 hypothetical protein E1288_45970 [Saccharopolyspora elongata]
MEELGSDAYVHGVLGESDQRAAVRVDGRTPPRIGEMIRVAVRDAVEIRVFDPDTTQRLAA